ncbi:hypothetical protein CU097_007706 [Rhizopus azygosporus]|uniref:Uncharacterized protein n=1 Tax=Rhizopus azygosporus TaxID=86630 RepID=A0A367J8M0_RHIAZ|nr:hypothetical protein CU097_007706 [Rhizopus azygosporus]
MHGYESKLPLICRSILPIDPVYEYPCHTKNVVAVFNGVLTGCLEIDPSVSLVCSLGRVLSNAPVGITGCAFHYRSEILCRFYLTSFPVNPRISARCADP